MKTLDTTLDTGYRILVDADDHTIYYFLEDPQETTLVIQKIARVEFYESEHKNIITKMKVLAVNHKDSAEFFDENVFKKTEDPTSALAL